MSLTKDDLQAIKKVIVETVQPMIDKSVDDHALQTENGLEEIRVSLRAVQATQSEHSATLQEHSATLQEHSATLQEQDAQLNRIESKLDPSIERVDKHDDILSRHGRAIRELQQKIA